MCGITSEFLEVPEISLFPKAVRSSRGFRPPPAPAAPEPTLKQKERCPRLFWAMGGDRERPVRGGSMQAVRTSSRSPVFSRGDDSFEGWSPF